MNAVPPSMIPGTADCKWTALREAGDVVAALAGVEPAEPFDFPALVRDAAEWRRALAERGVEDMTAAIRPGVAGLSALAAQGTDPRPAALALWREFACAREGLLAVMAPDIASESSHRA